MKPANKILPLLLVLLLAATVYGLIRTKGEPSAVPGVGTVDNTIVDQQALLTAQALVQLPTTSEEQPFAQDALRLADQEMDLAFASALLNATQHPPALSPEAKQIEARLQKAQNGLTTEQAEVAQLTAADAKATPAQKDALDNQLDLVKARLDLRQDEADDAKEDLIRAGGDPQDRIQAMVQEHEATSHASDATMVNVSAPVQARGLVEHLQQWWPLHQKQMALWRAKRDAVVKAAELSAKHDTLEAQTGAQDAQQQASAATSAAAAAAAGESAPAPATAPVPAAGAAPAAIARPVLTPQETVVALATTKRRAADRRLLASFDRRTANEQQLATIYGQWIDIVAAEQRVQVNRALRGILVILSIAVIAILVGVLLERLFGRMTLDRRQVSTLRLTTTVTLQIVAVLFVLLVVFGPPTQLGTFLGLAGAGLTVALKDFIVAFVGWFVLMGKSGIRLGDWVEINGVTGEVVQLGIFHTVLLETGNWTDSGHPTGRRVTFTNSYAVEGHYFNFSTSGQWMWDELKVVLPAGQNPYPVIDALQKKVTEATAEVVRQAEQEWQHAAKSHDMHSLSVAPTISVKPVVGGTEICVRYITSAHQRSQLRATINHAAVDLLGPGLAPQPEPNAPNAALASK